MKKRTLIGMLVGGGELQEMLESPRDLMELVVARANHEQLVAARHNRDMIAQFLIALDNPETHDDLKEVLHEALQDMSDQVARFEEHVG